MIFFSSWIPDLTTAPKGEEEKFVLSCHFVATNVIKLEIFFYLTGKEIF
jgi:hypothetical protein